MQIGQFALVVADYDEAIAWFTDKLGFELREDTDLGDKRWVRVAPPDGGCDMLLARAVNASAASVDGTATTRTRNNSGGQSETFQTFDIGVTLAFNSLGWEAQNVLFNTIDALLGDPLIASALVASIPDPKDTIPKINGIHMLRRAVRWM